MGKLEAHEFCEFVEKLEKLSVDDLVYELKGLPTGDENEVRGAIISEVRRRIEIGELDASYCLD